MIPKLFIITKLLLLMGVPVTGSASGSLAYYHKIAIRDVCQYRVERGWNNLDCQHPCLISAISPEHVGEYWLILLPDCAGRDRFKVCLTVDCGNGHHMDELNDRNEIAEISGRLAHY